MLHFGGNLNDFVSIVAEKKATIPPKSRVFCCINHGRYPWLQRFRPSRALAKNQTKNICIYSLLSIEKNIRKTICCFKWLNEPCSTHSGVENLIEHSPFIGLHPWLLLLKPFRLLWFRDNGPFERTKSLASIPHKSQVWRTWTIITVSGNSRKSYYLPFPQPRMGLNSDTKNIFLFR